MRRTFEQFLTVFNSLAPSQRITFAVIALLIPAGFLFFAWNGNSSTMVPLSYGKVFSNDELRSAEQALKELHAGRTKTWTPFEVPDEAIGCGFHEAVRGVLSHHVVIRDGKIANYHPYPPTPWNANPRDSYGTPGPYEDAVQNTPIFEENGREKFKGIDIMRAVRSFDPCLPCGVHMYDGGGKILETRHSPMFGTDASGNG